MAGLGRWAGFVLGLVIVGATFSSVVGTIVLPKGVRSLISFTVWRGIKLPFLAAAGRMRRYESKDRLLGLLGPVSLLALLGAWLLLLLLAQAGRHRGDVRRRGHRPGRHRPPDRLPAHHLRRLQPPRDPGQHAREPRRGTRLGRRAARPRTAHRGPGLARAVLQRLGVVGCRPHREPRELPVAAVLPLAVPAALVGGQPARGAGRRRPVPGARPEPGAVGGPALPPHGLPRVASPCRRLPGRLARRPAARRANRAHLRGVPGRARPAAGRRVPDGAVPGGGLAPLPRLAGELRDRRLPARRPAGGGTCALVR